MENLETALRLKEELDSLRPLDKEQESIIMQKFRLDWNYHSNNIEGNALSYGETKALLLFNITASGKPLKDHIEMEGHNEALNWIIGIVKEERPVTENFIRELHTLLLKNPYRKEALTADGKPTTRLIQVGQYKSAPNHVKTITGEIFRFATPEETPALMHDLLEWYRAEREKPDVNPIVLAALFHYKFIRIHPFDDGNGRTARILMNFILMSFGYPPVIVKTEDKESYYAVLKQADADVIEPFIDYITVNLIHSLELMIKGAKGGDVHEPEDLDKELKLLDLQIKELRGKTQFARKSDDVMESLYKEVIQPVLKRFLVTANKFQDYYSHVGASVEINGDTTYNAPVNQKSNLSFEPDLTSFMDTDLDSLVLRCAFIKFEASYKEHNYNSGISFEFYDNEYFVIIKGEKTRLMYADLSARERIYEKINRVFKEHAGYIKQWIKEEFDRVRNEQDSIE